MCSSSTKITDTMWYLLLFAVVLRISTADDPCAACFNQQCFERTSIFDIGYNFLGQIAVDYTTNNIYFHMSTPSNKSYNLEMNVKEAETFSVIKDVAYDDIFSRAVDQGTGDLYLGSVNGVFKYNPVGKRAAYFALLNQPVWHMQIHDGKLYYVLFDGENMPAEGMHIYDNGISYVVESLKSYIITDFIIDKQNDIYFVSSFKVYRLKTGEMTPTLFKERLFSLTTDRHNSAYFIKPSEKVLYKMNYASGNLDEVGLFPSPGTPVRAALDKDDNIVFYDGELKRMFYLMKTDAKCKLSKNFTP